MELSLRHLRHESVNRKLALLDDAVKILTIIGT